MTHVTRTCVVGALLLAAAAAAGAQPASAPTPMAPAHSASPTMPGASGAARAMHRSDAGFMKQAAQNGHVEVEASQLALTKATNADVKAFAQKMVDEHTKTGQQLNALASRKGVELPTGPSIVQKTKMKLLDTADGASFDRRYAKSIGVEAHEETVKLFERAAKDARDADVKAFAAQTLPALREHLKMARAL